VPIALICSPTNLDRELGATVLYRVGVVRQEARRVEEARTLAIAASPDIVVVDRDLPRADGLVAALRQDPSTRQLSIAVVSRGDFDPLEVILLEAGANAILRLPAGPEWDERLTRLMSVPIRRHSRFAVSFTVVALVGDYEDPVPASGLNVSRNGLLLETRLADLKVGDMLRLEMRLPEDLVFGQGRVVRLAGPGQYGVEFFALEDDGRERIARFVDTL
jgi:DNA-binding response OmpR family regulator